MIGLFNDCFPPIMDGVSVATANYAQWLQRLRGDVCVITPDAPGADDGSLPYAVHRYFSLPIPMRRPYRYGLPWADRSFRRTMRGLPLTLAHAHCPFSSGEVARSVAHSRGIPLVATFHSKYRADFERVIPNKRIVDKMVENIVEFYRQADEVWIPQESVGETLREYGYRGRMEVVENGNDFAGTLYNERLKTEAKRRLGVSAETPLLLFVGQHIWEKNVALILRSLALLGNVDFRMVFVGEGYAEKEMRKMAAHLGLSLGEEPKVRFVGPVYSREEMRQYYLAADLFLFPSLYDNAPLVVREAAAMHTPALMVAGSTAAAVINHGQNGFLTTASERDYAAALRRIVADRGALSRAAEGAAATLARSWEDIAAEVSDRYAHLISRSAHRAG